MKEVTIISYTLNQQAILKVLKISYFRAKQQMPILANVSLRYKTVLNLATSIIHEHVFRPTPLVCMIYFIFFIHMAHLFVYITPSYRISIIIISFVQQNIIKYTGCEYKSLSKSNYKMHLIEHSTEIPFSCTECDFNHRKQTISIFVHTGEFTRPTLNWEYTHTLNKVTLLNFVRKNFISYG